MPLFLSARQSWLVAPLVVCNVQLSSAVNTAIFSSFIFAFHLYVLFVNSNAHIMFVFFMEKEININLHTNRLEYHLIRMHVLSWRAWKRSSVSGGSVVLAGATSTHKRSAGKEINKRSGHLAPIQCLTTAVKVASFLFSSHM